MPGFGVGHHQIARMIVAMDEHARLREIVVEDPAKRLRQRLLLRRAERDAEMAADVPVGKECELAREQRLVVGRQHLGARGVLPADQRIGRVGIERRRRRGIECFEVGARAEIGEEQEALVLIAGEHLRRMEPGAAQQCGDADERTAVLAGGRRVHRDQRGVSAPRGVRRDAEIAAEARVRGRRRKRELAGAKRLLRPLGELEETGIARRDGTLRNGGVGRGSGHRALAHS